MTDKYGFETVMMEVLTLSTTAISKAKIDPTFLLKYCAVCFEQMCTKHPGKLPKFHAIEHNADNSLEIQFTITDPGDK